MRFNFNRTLQIGYGFSILMLVIVGIISYRTVNQLLESNRAVAHSNEVIQKLEKTISVMKDAETGQRGYLLTNRSQFLEPYHGAYREATGLVDQVASLTRDNPRQQQRMQYIRSVLLQRMTILQKLIDLKRESKPIAAADLDAGKSAMDALRQAINRAENHEEALLQKRILVLNRYAFLTPLFIILAICIGCIISLLSYVRVIRDLREKDRLREELEIKEQETAAFNEELSAANEEISAANEELTAINEELMEAREEVAAMNRSLEEKVERRTRALQESEEETQALNEELMSVNEELAAANEEYQSTNEELLRAHNELEKSVQLFQAIARSIPGSLIMVIGHDHRVSMLEGDLLDLLHYNSEGYAGKHLAEVTSAERYAANEHYYRRVLAGEQFRINRKGDSDADYQVDFVPLRDERNLVYAGLIIALDITDIKKAEERSAKLAAIVESSDDAIISKTLDGRITSWNPAAERLFGYKASEMIGQPISRLIPEDRREEEPQIIERLKQGGHMEHFETQRITREGKLVDFSLTISPIRDAEGRIIGASKIARDITEKKRDEIRKNDFIGMVSHELKTPLTSVTALIQLLHQKLSGYSDQFVPSALSKTNIQVKKMTAMINGFLNISRLESGQIHIDKHLFSLGELIEEVVDDTQLTVANHTFHIIPGSSLQVEADRDKIGSVLSNLLSNAVKYSPDGKTITIGYAVKDRSVVISVKDQGIGIDPADIDKLFERYYRVSSNHTRHIAGFGIGLYLCAEIIRRHDGQIWAESAAGEGSTFYFSLPLQ